MILHIFLYDKFSHDYIEKINELFDPKQHIFWNYGTLPSAEIRSVKTENSLFNLQYKSKICELYHLYRLMLKADIIIAHSLFVPKSYLLLFDIFITFRKKFFWNIWGGDLYDAYWERKDSIKLRIREIFRRYFIRKLKYVGYIPGDYTFLKEHYKTKAIFFLESYIYDFFVPRVEADESDKESINILLGNSATETSQYEKSIDMLIKYVERPIKVKCILSYPKKNATYREKIIRYGREKLGEKFVPIVDFMTYEKYTELLSGIDIAIFNHNRQQALGNIASLLYLGKRIFINPENACKSYFEAIGAKVFSTENLTEEDICKKNDLGMAEKNRKAIDVFFSDSEFYKRWSKVFEL